MSDATTELTKEALASIAQAKTGGELDTIALDYLGRKSGQVSRLLSGIGQMEPAKRAALGQAANEAKRSIEDAIAARRTELEGARLADIAETEAIDITFRALRWSEVTFTCSRRSRGRSSRCSRASAIRSSSDRRSRPSGTTSRR
jgi:phenylalanyl-tRNA synthetase alpha chain